MALSSFSIIGDIVISLSNATWYIGYVDNNDIDGGCSSYIVFPPLHDEIQIDTVNNIKQMTLFIDINYLKQKAPGIIPTLKVSIGVASAEKRNTTPDCT